ncbi:MAG TPA: hypothetical protein VGQ21_01935 [Thermoanaerobaculia bacterium]|jgi:hypothetical protein|nr:hypothetical protein [Thermoanaerobaculia bacterium]
MLTRRQRLAPRALALKKSWIMAAIMTGYAPVGEEGMIDDYEHWTAPRLRQFIHDLEGDLTNALTPLLARPRDAIRSDATIWLAERFDAWYASGLGLFTVSTAQAFEQRVGPLRVREQVELPPYTELLLQPGSSMAFRHPEYMLARDLVFLYELFRQAEDLLGNVAWSNPPKWAQSGSENAQSLARTVVLTCFNLLESFVSGLARAHAMEHPEFDEAKRKSLLDTHGPLRKRILGVPRAITANPLDLDINKPPLSQLMGPIKVRRDAFVHCEPGPEPSERGHVKEILFHDVGPEVVDEAVDATTTVIRRIWFAVHQTNGPRWLPERQPDGHFPGKNLTLGTGEP